MEESIETSDLTAVKIVEALYGKIERHEYDDHDEGCTICEEIWDFGELNGREERRVQRENILYALDFETVHEELQKRYDLYKDHDCCLDYFLFEFPNKLEELLMWARNGFIRG